MTETWVLLMPEEAVQDPIIHEIGHKFSVVTNIRHAEIKIGFGGIIVFEVEGDRDNLLKAEEFLSAKKIKVIR